MERQLTLLQKIILKDLNKLTFKDTISLFFYAVETIISDKNSESYEQWNSIYSVFQEEYEKQNLAGWPQINIIRNDYKRCIDVLFENSSHFIHSTNLFTLLYRLLYVENYKRQYIFKSYNYHKVLNFIVDPDAIGCVKTMNLQLILEMLLSGFENYMVIYNNEKNFEYQLAKYIVSQLK